MKLHRFMPLRKIVLGMLDRFGPGDICIWHHYVGVKFHLHMLKHKGYWYHGKSRENETMIMFQRLIRQNNTVIEVGGHIGYISLYFSSLVGEKGKVYVFEPGTNNLPYLSRNASKVSNIEIVQKAASNFSGIAPFYVENLTGQNNSLYNDYQMFHINAQYASYKKAYVEVPVDVVTLDSFVQEKSIVVDFVKIDVEGSELNVLQGMGSCLAANKPMLMIEITQKKEDVFELLSKHDYILFKPNGEKINDTSQISSNTFGLHKHHHQSELQKLWISNREL